MKKAMLFVITFVVANQIAAAEESMLKKYAPYALSAVVDGLVMAELESACRRQVSEQGKTNIANKKECAAKVDELLEVLGNGDNTLETKEYLIGFGRKNKLPVSFLNK